MSDCMFCEDFVGEENGDGGAQGYTIGKRDVCKACLSELKYRLNSVEAKSPNEREQKMASEDEEDEKESSEDNTTAIENSSNEENLEESNPFSAKAEP